MDNSNYPIFNEVSMTTLSNALFAKIGQAIGHTITASNVSLQSQNGTNESGSAVLLVSVAAGSEVQNFKVSLGWHQGDVQNVSAERINSAYG